MKKIEKAGETNPKKSEQPTEPAPRKGVPEAEENEPARYYSPPCMMGELDEIIDE